MTDGVDYTWQQATSWQASGSCSPAARRASVARPRRLRAGRRHGLRRRCQYGCRRGGHGRIRAAGGQAEFVPLDLTKPEIDR